jgi:hypothetical protein
MGSVKAVQVKSGTNALVQEWLRVYFCYRKLIDTDDSFSLLIQCPKPSRKLFPNPLKNQTTLTDQSTFSFKKTKPRL